MAGPFFYYSGVAGGTADGLSWANARASLTDMTGVGGGDIMYVAHDHDERSAIAISIGPPGGLSAMNAIICVDRTVASPGPGDWRTTAKITTTAGADIQFFNSFYAYGLQVKAGEGASTAANVMLAAGGGGLCETFEKCSFWVASTLNTTGASILTGVTVANSGNRLILNNCTARFSAANQTIIPRQGVVEWRNTLGAIDPSGTVPTTLFTAANFAFQLICEGVDFSAMVAGKNMLATTALLQRAFFHGCKLGGAAFPATGHPGSEIILSHCGDATNGGILRTEKLTPAGLEYVDMQIVRTGGAATAVPFSRAYIATGSTFLRPYVGLPMAKWNTTVNANLTLTIYGIRYDAGAPYNDQVWFEVSYLGDTATSPTAYIVNATKANELASGVQWAADTTSAWDSQVAYRQNNHTYNDGDFVRVASNPGRVFLSEGGGTTGSSEPAGFAGLTDGTGLTDGDVYFSAMSRFKMTITLSAPQPKQVGVIYITPKIGIAINLFWLDPEIN